MKQQRLCPVCWWKWKGEPGDYTPSHGNGDEPCDGIAEPSIDKAEQRRRYKAQSMGC